MKLPGRVEYVGGEHSCCLSATTLRIASFIYDRDQFFFNSKNVEDTLPVPVHRYLFSDLSSRVSTEIKIVGISTFGEIALVEIPISNQNIIFLLISMKNAVKFRHLNRNLVPKS
jgi:hypothetical protein